ncbi:hypothetical protein [uncultured Pseudodesulfovibrio sp.]|uniref:hypothetical protein n=1 Tax=uncultured Pseudodesulfovibrio sp. TaxID=2035858 RepID=UPI0029C6C600|nr:hypothetical protein [uncultured Pseudodesulfovibrio sp.]
MPRFQKKPVVIEAVIWDGNADTANTFIGEKYGSDWSYEAGSQRIIIPTLEGDHIGNIGDFIIKGVKGEFYPCKPDVFEATYEAPGRDLSKRDELLSAACPLMESLDRMSPYTYLLITSTEARLVQEEQFALNPKYATTVHRPVNE